METGEKAMQVQKKETEEQEVKVEYYGNFEIPAQKQFELAQKKDLSLICEYLQTDTSRSGDIGFRVYDNLKAKQAADSFQSISPYRCNRFTQLTNQ